MPDAKSKYNEDASNDVLGTDLLGMGDRRSYSIVKSSGYMYFRLYVTSRHNRRLLKSIQNHEI